jgi:hypothetical protein
MGMTGEELIGRLDQVGVDRAVIFPYVEVPDNVYIDEQARRYSDRLIPMCSVNPWQTGALDEVRHCVADLGFKGVKLHPLLHGYRLSDHSLVDPIFELARELDFVITCHGWTDLNNSPWEFNEMARAFPEVTLIWAHMGVPHFPELAVEIAREHPNLYLEGTDVNAWLIASAVRALGPEKVIWGTDAPFCDYEWEFKKMRRVTDSEEAYQLLVGGNIARLMRLPIPVAA